MAFKTLVEYLGQIGHTLYHESTTAEEFIVNNVRYGVSLGDTDEEIRRGDIIFHNSEVWNDPVKRARIMKYVEPGIMENVEFSEELQLLTCVQVYDSKEDYNMYYQLMAAADFEFAEIQEAYVHLTDKVVLETYEE